MINQPPDKTIGGKIADMLPGDYSPEGSVDSVFTGDQYQTAGLVTSAAKAGSKARKAILEPLTKGGVRTPEATGGNVRVQRPVAPDAVAQDAVAPEAVAPDAVAPETITPADPAAATSVVPEVVKPAVFDTPTQGSVGALADRRQQLINNGGPGAAPSPTAGQVEAGVVKGQINTTPLTPEDFAYTMQAAAEQLPEVTRMKMSDIHRKALDQGVLQSRLDEVFAGKNMESLVGEDKLAINVASLIHMNDESFKVLDGLMVKAAAGVITDAEKVLLYKQMAASNMFMKQLKGVQVDVARTMNAFKRSYEDMPASELQKFMDDMASGGDLRSIAEQYNNASSIASKGRILEASLSKKGLGIVIYTALGNVLSNPATHLYNLTSGAAMVLKSPLDQVGGAAVGKIRGFFGGNTDDAIKMQEVAAGLSGFYNGTIDGFISAFAVMKKGGPVNKLGVSSNPLTAENLSNTPVATMFGKEYRTPNLVGTPIAPVINAIGFIPELLSFRPIAAGDAFFNSIASRYMLHQQAYMRGAKELDRLIADGVPEDEAMKIVQRQSEEYLTTRPSEMQDMMTEEGNTTTFQGAFDLSTGLGRTYDNMNRFANNPFIKPFVMFSKTILKISDYAAAHIPVLNLISPEFHKMWKEGGRSRDVASFRLTLGATVGAGALTAAMEDRITGSGPFDLEQRRALEATGWQQYSIIFNDGVVSEKNISRLTAAGYGVTAGNGRIYVSYARIDPFSQMLAMGADMGDIIKFRNQGDDNESGLNDLFLAYAASNAKYMSNMPLMSGMGEILQTLRTNHEDQGEKFTLWAEGFAKQYVNFIALGIPVFGMTHGSAANQLTRTLDPVKRSTLPETMDQKSKDLNEEGRWFAEAIQKIRSRIPGLSKDMEPNLDNLGRIMNHPSTYRDHWLNYIPVVRASKAKESVADAALAALNTGISTPARKWDGIGMSSKQYNKFKSLYGQEVMLPQIDSVTGETIEVNLESAIINLVQPALMVGKPMLNKTTDNYGSTGYGDMQNAIKALVTDYRTEAKKRMIGVWNEDTREFDDHNKDAPIFVDLRDAIRTEKMRYYQRGR